MSRSLVALAIIITGSLRVTLDPSDVPFTLACPVLELTTAPELPVDSGHCGGWTITPLVIQSYYPGHPGDAQEGAEVPVLC